MGVVRRLLEAVLVLTLLAAPVLGEQTLFNHYSFQFEDTAILTSAADTEFDSYAQGGYFIGPNPPYRQTNSNPPISAPLPFDPTNNLQINYRVYLPVYTEGSLIFKNKFRVGDHIILQKADETKAIIMSAGKLACPGNTQDATTGNYPFCVYDRDGNLIYSSRTSNNWGEYGELTTKWASRYNGATCPAFTGSPDSILWCGSAAPTIHVYPGDRLFFYSDTNRRLNGYQTGIQLTALEQCDTYQTTDHDTDAGICRDCPAVGAGGVGEKSWRQDVADAGLPLRIANGTSLWPTTNQPQACCGDDSNDCGKRLEDAYLCAKDTNGNYSWEEAAAKKGNVVSLDACSTPPKRFLSNGTGWVECGWQTFSPHNPIFLNSVSGNLAEPDAEYACLYNYYGSAYSNSGVYVCCPQGTCGSGATRLTTGDALLPNLGYNLKIPGIGPAQTESQYFPPNYLQLDDPNQAGFQHKANINIPYYRYIFCTDHSTFAADLDSENITCGKARFNNAKLNISWTGSKCCGDLLGSSYNDPGKAGACYLGEPLNNSWGPGKGGKVKAINGTLRACDPSAAYSPSDPTLLLKDENNANLVQMTSTCAYDSKTAMYCDIDGYWKNTAQAPPLRLSKVAPTQAAAKSTACCPTNTCWDGASCYPDQSTNSSSAPPKGDGYRCIAGAWTLAYAKTKPHSAALTTDPQNNPAQTGYCPRSDQCFVSANGNATDNDQPAKNPQCIASSRFIGDDYCESGQWTTRTRLLALTMLKTVGKGTDFTLYCGPAKDTLNYYKTTIGATAVESFFVNTSRLRPGFNQVCVLQKGGNYLIGLSYNGGYVGAKQSLSTLFPTFSCTPGQGLTACGSKGWVDDQLGIAIASTAPQTYTIANPNPEATFIQPQIDSLFTTLPKAEPGFSYGFKGDGLNLNWLYIQRKNGQEAFATIDEGTLIARYTPPDTAKQKLCDAINGLRSRYFTGKDSSDTACAKTATEAAIIVSGYQTATFNPYQLWPDASGRMRPP